MPLSASIGGISDNRGMNALPSTPAPTVTDTVTTLRADLESAEYTVDRIRELVGEVANDALHREQRLPALRAVESVMSPLAVLVRFFVVGLPISADERDLAFPRTSAQALIEMGVAAQESEEGAVTYRALVNVQPVVLTDTGGEVTWWLASDLGETATGRALHPDHVLGAGGASFTLAQVTPRTNVGRVLDIGTGCGVQALAATRHARQVVATDISPRAVAFARFNAALNDSDVEIREGSFFEPVHGETFDLVVSNPPFVITPRTGTDLALYEYRDGGAAGDRVVAQMVTDVPHYLAAGGCAVMLGNWEVTAGSRWDEGPRAWIEQARALHGDLDAWVIQREFLDPAHYAETWLRDGGMTQDRDRELWESAYRAWLDDFASRTVEGVGFGIIVIRRPVQARAAWTRCEEITGDVSQPLGPTIAATLAGVDVLKEMTDHELLEQRLRTAADVTEERYITPGVGEPSVIIIRQGGGLRRAVQADTVLAGFVSACDGELTAGQIMSAICALMDLPVDDTLAATLPTIRGLITDGILTFTA